MAASILSQLFCGCCGSRSHSTDDTCDDERTRLIRPVGTDQEPSTSSYGINQQVLRDRLGIIVRAKESKMVNVNNALPFNLHNKTLHGRLELDPSSSRSRSAHAILHGPTGRRAPSSSHSQSHSHSPPPRGRDPSPSILTSRSNSSLHPGDASYLPPEADPSNGVRKPILNARLIRGPGVGGFGVGGTISGSRKSRTVTRGRLGRFEPNDSGGLSTEQTQSEVDSTATPGNGLVIHIDSSGASSTSADGSGHTSAHGQQPGLGDIQDVGKITCSWGD